jgi:hypothetical protein
MVQNYKQCDLFLYICCVCVYIYIYKIMPCLQLEIGFGVVDLEARLKAQTYSTVLTPK